MAENSWYQLSPQWQIPASILLTTNTGVTEQVMPGWAYIAPGWCRSPRWELWVWNGWWACAWPNAAGRTVSVSFDATLI